MTEIQKHRADEMTPVERKKAIEEGKSYDRVPCVPFMGELKGVLSGISVWDLSHDPEKMAEAEIIPFNRYGYDRMDIGPNSCAAFSRSTILSRLTSFSSYFLK